jgi:xanthine dehydrogenase YagR molybdenum-binding subunit
VQSTIARGRITAIETSAAQALDGVVVVLTHLYAPQLASDGDKELWILQSDEVAYRSQLVAAVIAETPEVARHAASLIRVDYDEYPHDVELRSDRDDLYAPEVVTGAFETDTSDGDVDRALSSAAVTLDETYTTPMEHHNPMEPHTTVAIWHSDDGVNRLTLYDSNQGASTIQAEVAAVFGLAPRHVEVISPHVGGAFGSKLLPKAHHILTGLAARLVAGRPVKLALTRQQMFAGTGYRTPTIQRVQLGADSNGRLTAIAHDVVEQTSKIKEFAEQTALGTRTMYAAANRRTTHRLAALDVPVPTIMRAPGEAPGMFALESAMNEMAELCGLDPIEFRLRNEPETDPETGLPYSTRNLIACLEEGARRFGWQRRNPAPRGWRNGDWLVGMGVAASTFPTYPDPGASSATIRAIAGGRYRVEMGASDIGTGSWTALTQIAADALDVPVEAVELHIGETVLPAATPAAGSMGINNWGGAIVEAAREFRNRHGTEPNEGDEASATDPENPDFGKFAMRAFGAQFAEVRVNADTGEIRVPRLLGVFAAGRIINPLTARSQLIGGMTMGLSMALHEKSVVDPRFGHVVNHDFVGYHVATNADVKDIEATWIDEFDPHYNPMGAKGIGEIGIVGTAAAVANAVYNATGIRVRDLPITPDKLLR